MNVPETPVHAVPDDAFLLDVREPEEWVAGHAPGAVHIPLFDLPARVAEVPEDVTVYVVCRVGGRSAQATAWLNQLGRKAVNVAGGMMAWAAADRPMAAENGQPPYVACRRAAARHDRGGPGPWRDPRTGCGLPGRTPVGEAGGPLGTGYGTRAGAHAPASGDARILRAARNRCRTFFFRAFLAVFPHAGAGRDGPAGGSVYLALA